MVKAVGAQFEFLVSICIDTIREHLNAVVNKHMQGVGLCQRPEHSGLHV